MEIEILRSLPQCNFLEEVIEGHDYSIADHVRPALDHHTVGTGVVFNEGLQLRLLFRAPFEKRLKVNLVEKKSVLKFSLCFFARSSCGDSHAHSATGDGCCCK